MYRDVINSLYVSILVHNEVTSSLFMSMHAYAHVDLKDVLDEGTGLSTLLHFITGESAIPPMGLKHPIELLYHPPMKNAIFMGAQACYAKVILPVVHESKQDFFAACIKSLKLGGHSYGNA